MAKNIHLQRHTKERHAKESHIQFPSNKTLRFILRNVSKNDYTTVNPSQKRVKTFLNKRCYGTLIQRITV